MERKLACVLFELNGFFCSHLYMFSGLLMTNGELMDSEDI